MWWRAPAYSGAVLARPATYLQTYALTPFQHQNKPWMLMTPVQHVAPPPSPPRSSNWGYAAGALAGGLFFCPYLLPLAFPFVVGAAAAHAFNQSAHQYPAYQYPAYQGAYYGLAPHYAAYLPYNTGYLTSPSWGTSLDRTHPPVTSAMERYFSDMQNQARIDTDGYRDNRRWNYGPDNQHLRWDEQPYVTRT